MSNKTSTVILTVVLTFDGSVNTDKQIAEVANNVNKAIVDQINCDGLAPDDDCITQSVEVAHNGLILASETLYDL